MGTKPQRILIVDDNKVNVELIRAQLKNFPYELESAFDGEEALQKIAATPPDLVLLDLMMPKVSGYEVCQQVKQNHDTQFIPIIVITALQELEDKLKAIELGADDFLVKPFNKIELTTRIRSLLHMKSLHDDLVQTEHIMFSLAKALDAKDPYTQGHSERVATYAALLATAMDLDEDRVKNIRRGGLMHDIGKIAVPDGVLTKPGKLTDEEMEIIKSHPERGYEICSPIKTFAPCLASIRSHHERIDGRGYPDGLAGDDIPLDGRIMAIADSFDAMTTTRRYRKSMSFEQAIQIMEQESTAGQWDPTILPIFIDLVRRGQLRS